MRPYGPASRTDPVDHAVIKSMRPLEARSPEVVEDFGRAINLDPGTIDARYERARFYRKLGEADEALRDYDELIRLRPDDPSILRDRQLAVEEAEAARR